MRESEKSEPKIINSQEFYFNQGGLYVFDSIDRVLGFSVNRIFIISGVPTGEIRGNHAHKICSQVLIATSGSMKVSWKNATKTGMFELNSPSKMLIVPPMNWLKLFDFSGVTASLTVLASHNYDEGDYIRNESEFTEMIR